MKLQFFRNCGSRWKLKVTYYVKTDNCGSYGKRVTLFGRGKWRVRASGKGLTSSKYSYLSVK